MNDRELGAYQQIRESVNLVEEATLARTQVCTHGHVFALTRQQAELRLKQQAEDMARLEDKLAQTVNSVQQRAQEEVCMQT
jgi:hypothetical protein